MDQKQIGQQESGEMSNEEIKIYELCAPTTTFSKQEMDFIRELLEYTDTKAALAGMSIKGGSLERQLGKRERTEFLEKLKQGDAE